MNNISRQITVHEVSNLNKGDTLLVGMLVVLAYGNNEYGVIGSNNETIWEENAECTTAFVNGFNWKETVENENNNIHAKTEDPSEINNVNDLLKYYGLYVGKVSLESFGDTDENKKLYIVYPDDYISKMEEEYDQLPPKHVVEEFFNKFYESESTYLLLENFNWDI